MTTDTASPFSPGGIIDRDPLPAPVGPHDARRHVYVILRVNRVYPGARAVRVETPDVFRGGADMPTAWMPAGTVPRHGGTYRFCIPAFRWNIKREHLLSLTRLRAESGMSDGPAPAA